MTRLLHILLLALLCTSTAMAGSWIAGRLVGADGRPLPVAHLQVLTESGKAESRVAADGRFSTAIDRLGAVRVLFGGVGHQPHAILFHLDAPDSIVLDIRLASWPLERSFDQVAVIGSFNRFDKGSARAMRAEGEGVWSLEVPTSEPIVEYRLLGVAAGQAIEGTTFEDVRYDGRGGYISRIRSTRGIARILFDSSRVARGSTSPTVVVRAASARTRESMERYRRYRAELASHRSDMAVVATLSDDSAGAYMEAWTIRRDRELRERLAATGDRWERQLLYATWHDLSPALNGTRFSYLHELPAPRPLLPEVIPALSPLWIDSPDALRYAIVDGVMGEAIDTICAYLQQVIRDYPDRELRATAAFTALDRAGGVLDPACVRALYTGLLQNDSGDAWGRIKHVQIFQGIDPLVLHPGRLRPHSRISGRLLDSNGAPVAGATVRVDFHWRSIDSIESVTSDSNGAFVLPLVHEGILPLQIWKKELLPHRADLYIDRPTEAEIVFHLSGVADPDRYDYGEAPARIEFVDSTATLVAVTREIEKRSARIAASQAADREESASTGEARPKRNDPVTTHEIVWNRLLAARDSLARQFLLLDYIYMAALTPIPDEAPERDLWRSRDSMAIAEVIREVPATSCLWATRHQLPMFFIWAADSGMNDQTTLAYIERMTEHHPSVDLRAEALQYLAYELDTDTLAAPESRSRAAAGRAAYTKLVERYPYSREAVRVRSDLAPDRPIRKGALVPRFALRSIGGDSTLFTPAALDGRYYLLDFWATWCGPCIAEIDSLQSLYTRFHDRGFEILGVSFDGSPDDVGRFRAKKWSMPWLHAFASGGFRSEIALMFNVDRLPQTVLVGPDGRIVAVDLRGEELSATLEAELGMVK